MTAYRVIVETEDEIDDDQIEKVREHLDWLEPSVSPSVVELTVHASSTGMALAGGIASVYSTGVVDIRSGYAERLEG